MKKIIAVLGIFIILTTACSSGKKALQKGYYFSAVSKAVQRLKSSPDNKNALKVLKEGYQLALDWSQEEMDLILSSNAVFKWENAINQMVQVNRLSEEIRSTPAARRIIPEPKTYSSELNMAYEKAAEERYKIGIEELNKNTRDNARSAFDNFMIADRYVPGYKNVDELMETAKIAATLKVVLQSIPVYSQKYRLSSEFFYDQVFEYVNRQFGPNGFVNFYTPFQAEKEKLNNPDLVVNMEFYDFSVGNLVHAEKEETLQKKVKQETRDTTKVTYKTYTAKLKTFSDQVISGGNLRVRITEPATDKLLFDELFPGSFTWINEYAIFVGDIEALDQKQVELTKRKTLPLPPEQDLFIEFTKPIYSQLTSSFNRFFGRYN